MNLRPNGSASRTSSRSSSDVNVPPPLASALPSLLIAICFTEQAGADTRSMHAVSARRGFGLFSILFHQNDGACAGIGKTDIQFHGARDARLDCAVNVKRNAQPAPHHVVARE